MATGSDVYVYGVRQRRVKMLATSMTAADSDRPGRSHSLRHDSVLHAPRPHVRHCPRRAEVDQGEVDELTRTDDDPPRTRRRPVRTEVGR